MENVVVIGAGITGCFTAYFLAEQGVPVTLIDPDGPGRQASGNNPGGLNPFHGPGIPGPSLPLAMRAFQLHLDHEKKIAARSGANVPIHRVTRIELAFDDSEASSLETTRPLYEEAAGFSARILDRGALRREEPRCREDAVAGLFTSGNGMIDGPAYTRAVCRAAEQAGARFVKAKVRAVESGNGDMLSIMTDDDSHPCTAVVLATGAWMREPERWLGASIPVEPLKGQLLLAELPGEPLRHHVTHLTDGIYHLPGGNVWLGGTLEKKAGYDRAPTPEGRSSILDKTTRLLPCLRSARIVDHVAALRPATPDGLPVVDRVPGWDNVYVASGAGPKGMLLGPGLAEGVISLLREKSPAFALEPFSLGRFNRAPNQASANPNAE